MADKVKNGNWLMNFKKNLVIVDFGFMTGRVFGPLFHQVSIYRSPSQITKDSVILFEGGTDISTDLYNEPQGKYTHEPHRVRDTLETAVFNLGKKNGAAFIGICRGAQLLTVLSGGSLFQDVTEHDKSHWMKTDCGRGFGTTSIHHQMMNPFVLPEDEYQLVAWAVKGKHNAPEVNLESEFDSRSLSSYYLNGWNKQEFIPPKEPEVVWYPKTKSLCIQGHPEFAKQDSTLVKYSRELVERFILQPCNN